MLKIFSQQTWRISYKLALLGVLFLGLGMVGFGISQWKHMYTVPHIVERIETYIAYETQTYKVLETQTIVGECLLVTSPIRSTDQPPESRWYKGFPFSLDGECTNYHLLVDASKNIYIIAILRHSDFENWKRSPAGFSIDSTITKEPNIVFLKTWLGKELIDETIIFPPGDYVLFFLEDMTTEASFTLNFVLTQDCENIVTEIVPLEKTRQVTEVVYEWITVKPYGFLLWPSIIAITLGSGLLIYVVLRRKKAPVTISKIAVDKMSCNQARKEKDNLVEEINRLKCELDEAEKEADNGWDKYIEFARKAGDAQRKTEQTHNELRLLEDELKSEKSRRKVYESNYERELENQAIDMAVRNRLDTGLIEARKDTKKIIDSFEARLVKARQASEKAEKITRETREARDTASVNLDKTDERVKDINKTLRERINRLREILSKRGYCINCCEIKRIYDDINGEWEKRKEMCSTLQNEAKLREQDADNAGSVEKKANQKADDCKNDDSFKKAAAEAKQKLKDFIDNGIFHDGITTDAEEASEKGFENMVGISGLSWDEDIIVYFRGDAEAKFLANYFHQGNLQALRRELARKRNDLKNHEEKCKIIREEAATKKLEAQYLTEWAKRAKNRAERCIEILDTLKEQADFFETTWKKCVQNLEKCRDKIVKLTGEVKKRRKELDESMNKLEDKISELEKKGNQIRKCAEDYEDYPDTEFESIGGELDSAISRYRSYLDKLKQVPEPKFEEPEGGEYRILEDCWEIEGALGKELKDIELCIEKCRVCCDALDNDAKTLTEKISMVYMRVKQRETQLMCNREFLDWIKRNLKDDPDLLAGTLKKISVSVSKYSAEAAKEFVSTMTKEGYTTLTSLAKAGAVTALRIGYGLFVAWVEGHLKAAAKRIADNWVLRFLEVELDSRRQGPCGVITTKDMQMKDVETYFFFRKGNKVLVYRITHMYGLEFLGVVEQG